jgi:RNA polymerase sigma-70 factor (ECF subfamily)
MPAPDRQAAFQAALDAHHRLIGKVAGAYARTAEDRRDLVQQIALELWRAYPTYDPVRAKISTWMYRIALNVAISHLRRARTVEPLDPDTLPVPDTRSTQDERIEAVFAMLAQFPPLDRALVLLYLDDHSYAEIAEVLGLSETNVATKLSRIKQTLRARAKKGA